jgi:hypothetical protein
VIRSFLIECMYRPMCACVYILGLFSLYTRSLLTEIGSVIRSFLIECMYRPMCMCVYILGLFSLYTRSLLTEIVLFDTRSLLLR